MRKKNKMKVIILEKKWDSYDSNLALAKTLPGVKIKHSLFGRKTKIYVPEPKRNPNLSGKGVRLVWPNGYSEIIHK